MSFIIWGYIIYFFFLVYVWNVNLNIDLFLMFEIKISKLFYKRVKIIVYEVIFKI